MNRENSKTNELCYFVKFVLKNKICSLRSSDKHVVLQNNMRTIN